MTNCKTIFSKHIWNTLTQFSSAIIILLRNIIIARILGPENMGIATTFIIFVTFLEMSTEISIDKYIIQYKHNVSDKLIACLHGIHLSRYLLISVGTLVLALPLAILLNQEHLITYYISLSVIPILKGFSHLEIRLEQKDMKYKRFNIAKFSTDFCILIALLPITLFYKDFTAVILILILESGISTIISHILAKKKYQLTINRNDTRSILRFGLPMVINSIIIFTIIQGDRLLIGTFYNMATLGKFTVTFGLTLMLALLISRINTMLCLPLLSKARKNIKTFEQTSMFISYYFSTIALIYAAVFLIFGELILSILYGNAYALPLGLIMTLAIMNALRIMRDLPSIITLSLGKPKRTLSINLYRCFGLFISGYLAYNQYPLIAVTTGGVIGELIALGISYKVIKNECGKCATRWYVPICYTSFAIGILFTLALVKIETYSIIIISSIVIISTLLASIIRLRKYYSQIIHSSIINKEQLIDEREYHAITNH